MTKLVGLTGGIATGKSTASAFFKKKGFVVIDLDELARVVVQPGRPAYNQIVAYFGREFLKADGTVDRQRLGKKIFEDGDARRKLNSITHYYIKLEVLKQVLWHMFVLGTPVVILDTPLLFEAGLDKFMGMTVVMYTDEKTQRERLKRRDNIGDEDAQMKIAAQMPMAEKTKRATHVIDNSEGIERTNAQLEDFCNSIRPSQRIITPRSILQFTPVLASVLFRLAFS